jgi:hypothetical protein
MMTILKIMWKRNPKFKSRKSRRTFWLISKTNLAAVPYRPANARKSTTHTVLSGLAA